MQSATLAFYDTWTVQPDDRDAARRYLHGVWSATRHVETLLEQSGLESAGIGFAEFVLLEHIAHTDLGPSQIAASMRLPDHTVSRLLGRLERAGQLERAVARDDARRRRLRLTPAGHARLAHAQGELTDRLAPLLGDLGPRRVKALTEGLALVVAAQR